MRALALARWTALVVVALVAAACGGGSTETATDDASASSSTVTVAASTTTGQSLVASTTSTAATATTSSTTEESTTSTEVTTTSETTSQPSTSTSLIDGGSLYEFSSPTGNIACVMSEQFTSCWISKKTWTIDQPDDPDCELSDWGNAVDLTADGPGYPCYTDMLWNIFAPALPYDAAVDVGPFRCLSARTGVTCTNASGQGFTVARASVQLF